MTLRTLLDLALDHPQTTVDDIKSMENDLLKLEQDMLKCVQRIPHNTHNNTYEDNPTFNQWARIILSALGDKNWWLMRSPLLHRIINPVYRRSSSM